MHTDVASLLKSCPTCLKDRPSPPPEEPPRAISKGRLPFQGWSIDAAGPMPADEDGNTHLLVAIDPFSKWIEALPVPSLHSWRAADFLHQQIICRWGKPLFVQTDNGAEF